MCIFLCFYHLSFLFSLKHRTLLTHTNKLFSLLTLRRPADNAAVRGRCPGVLRDPQYVEAGGRRRDCGPLRFGLHHPQWQRPPQVHPPVRHAVEASQEHPRGPRVGDQRHLGHSRAAGAASRSERQVPAAGRCGSLHTRARPLQR